MLDWILNGVVVGLPTLLSVVGVLFSIRLPHAKHRPLWYGGLIAVGLLTSGVTLWQQSRTQDSHAAEVATLNGSLKQLREQVTGLQQHAQTLVTGQSEEAARRREAERILKEQTAALTQSQDVEIARRKQAERDLQTFVSAVGNSTRLGVAEDIKKSPIRVEVNGKPTRDPAEITRVREGLADHMRAAARLRDRCSLDPPGSKLEEDVEAWYRGVQEFLLKNLDKSFVGQFTVQKSSSFLPNGVPEKRVYLWVALDQRIDTLSRFIDQLK